MKKYNQQLAVFVLLGLRVTTLYAADWPMLGRDATRNPVSLEQGPPLAWDVGSFDRRTKKWVDPGKNVRWRADLGVGVYASPVVADGLVWIGANSQGLEDHKDEAPAALLRCYRESDGELLYEYVSPRIKGNSRRDPPWHGLSCSPSRSKPKKTETGTPSTSGEDHDPFSCRRHMTWWRKC